MRNISPFGQLAVSLAVIGILSFPPAALGLEFNIENDTKDHRGEIIIVVENDLFAEEPVTYCGITYEEFRVVILDPGAGGPPIITFAGVEQGSVVNPGDRFEIVGQAACDGRLQINGHQILQGITTVFFWAPAGLTLGADDLDVVTGGADEDGISEVLFQSPGQKPVTAPVFGDLELRPSDVLVDIFELEVDPETGNALYGALLEY